MLTAKQKRKENIIEYFLYLFQVEDLIRVHQFDISLIKKNLIPQYQVDEKTRAEITNWYGNLAKMMEKEGIGEKGHLQFLTNLINEVNEIHLKLMEMNNESDYVMRFQSVAGLINELNRKNNSAKNDVQTGLDAIYGFLLLKMQNKEVTPETTEAIQRISGWLKNLSLLFKDYESGNLEII